jgi:hypothetical protein
MKANYMEMFFDSFILKAHSKWHKVGTFYNSRQKGNRLGWILQLYLIMEMQTETKVGALILCDSMILTSFPDPPL